ncbi:MAG TPA: hydrogenase maturation nickel metallochaperone HypA [Vicinamibacterales bacterium]|nr:hydrogenase maturation nickel metallochaperone HypA [Vicinamibacterales bacterium]
MHELGVAAGILDIVRQHVPVSDARRVRAVRVRLGEIAGVVPDSLDFCFGAIVAGTPYASAFLAIERVPARGRCGGCGRLVEVSRMQWVCPWCGGLGLTVTSGDELHVADVELDDTVEVAL